MCPKLPITGLAGYKSSKQLKRPRIAAKEALALELLTCELVLEAQLACTLQLGSGIGLLSSACYCLMSVGRWGDVHYAPFTERSKVTHNWSRTEPKRETTRTAHLTQ